MTELCIYDLSFYLGMHPEDEWNLLYVAVTRAKKCLLMSQSLEHLLALAGVSEILPKCAKPGAGQRGVLIAALCGTLLQSKPINLAEQHCLMCSRAGISSILPAENRDSSVRLLRACSNLTLSVCKDIWRVFL